MGGADEAQGMIKACMRFMNRMMNNISERGQVAGAARARLHLTQTGER